MLFHSVRYLVSVWMSETDQLFISRSKRRIARRTFGYFSASFRFTSLIVTSFADSPEKSTEVGRDLASLRGLPFAEAICTETIVLAKESFLKEIRRMERLHKHLWPWNLILQNDYNRDASKSSRINDYEFTSLISMVKKWARVWRVYFDEAKNFDSSIDVLVLVFAGIFATVATFHSSAQSEYLVPPWLYSAVFQPFGRIDRHTCNRVLYIGQPVSNSVPSTLGTLVVNIWKRTRHHESHPISHPLWQRFWLSNGSSTIRPICGVHHEIEWGSVIFDSWA